MITDLVLVIVLSSFGVVILWSTLWAVILRGRMILFIPFILAGFSSLFFSGVLVGGALPFSADVIRWSFVVCNIIIMIFVARRKIWKRF